MVLVDVDPDPDKPEWCARRTLRDCGMTRATVRLEMLVNRNNPECRRFLKA